MEPGEAVQRQRPTGLDEPDDGRQRWAHRLSRTRGHECDGTGEENESGKRETKTTRRAIHGPSLLALRPGTERMQANGKARCCARLYQRPHPSAIEFAKKSGPFPRSVKIGWMPGAEGHAHERSQRKRTEPDLPFTAGR